MENGIEKRSIRLGLLMTEEKKRKYKLPKRIQTMCSRENILITEINVYGDLESQGPFDILLHKISELHKKDIEEAERLIKKVLDYCSQHPDMLIVDDLEVVLNLMSRSFQYSLLSKCTMSVDDISVYIPKTLKIDEQTSIKQNKQRVQNAGIRFPVLAKPIPSCKVQGSHEMVMVFDIDNIQDIPVPCLLQEFCNHGGVLYKVFVIGDRINVFQRPSIQDVKCHKDKSSIIFESRNVSKHGKQFVPELHGTDPRLRTWHSCVEKPDLLSKKVLTALQQRIFELTAMRMYAIDILVDSQGDYAVVDLGHFPGFSGMRETQLSENIFRMIKMCVNDIRDKVKVL